MLKINKKIKIIAVILIIISLLIVIYYIYSNNYDIDIDKSIDITEENKKEKEDKEESKIEKVEENLITIHIAGCVVNQGIIKILEGSRIADAIEIAGGLTDEADISTINLATILEDGVKIYIPKQNEIQENVEKNVENSITYSNDNKKSEKININSASQGELETLPGIGTSTANNIIKYRKENGKFKDIEDLKNVKGIGNNKFEKIKELVSIK